MTGTVWARTSLLLLLWAWFDGCEGLNDSSLPAIFYPFGRDEGDRVVPVSFRCRGPIQMPSAVFRKRTFYVCINGLISFGSRDYYKTSRSQPTVPFIAPNKFDLHNSRTRIGGRVYYRVTYLNDASGSAEKTRCISRGLCKSTSNSIIVVTWYNVEPPIESFTVNTFQLILTSDEDSHNITFNYAKLQDRGTAGYNGLDLHHHYYINSSVDLVRGTNVGRPGQWTFTVSSNYTTTSANYTKTVRLAGSPNPVRGRLEILIDGIWGTVCDDGFGHKEAIVACYTLGFGRVGRHIPAAYYKTKGIGQIWLDDVMCGGYEVDIRYCPHDGWGVHNCDHSEDVWISCSDEHINVRLVEGPNNRTGRVEIKYNGVWGTVCGNSFTNSEASAVCRMLQFDLGRVHYGLYGEGTGRIWLDNVRCGGSENTISDCWHKGWGTVGPNCDHSRDVWVSCYYYKGSEQLDSTSVALLAALAPVFFVFAVLISCCLWKLRQQIFDACGRGGRALYRSCRECATRSQRRTFGRPPDIVLSPPPV